MFKQRMKVFSAGLAGTALVLLSGCSALTGDDSGNGSDTSEDGFTDVTSQVASWDMCEVLSPDPIRDKAAATTYAEGPNHVDMGSAIDAESVSCRAEIEVVDTDGTSIWMQVHLGVFPGNSTEHVDDMWAMRQEGWYRDNVETNVRDLTAEDLLIDADLEGEWDQAHAYAILGTEGERSGEAGSMIVDARTSNYIVEAYLTIPTDAEKTAAARYGLSQEEIDARTALAFDRSELVNWVADEYIYTMFEAVSSQLES
ncbi:hypothetical protein O1R50_25705 [Glycomyces luteolus]|uniref:Uncharacterized protein n=1 Tax=Glycomyces luteolus TaxID=2670330 RepID=A0A9X3PQ05_9ACTN|nr:hypothetical protein [Glycomyces luteolus]MDA1363035.1 hypothetical protein [Glycomyces luteolus]